MEPEKDIFEQWAETREAMPFYKRYWHKISQWWRFSGRYLHRDFIIGVKSIFYWLPIIWRDRNWDHSSIFTIMAHKIEAQSKYIGGRDIHVSAKRDAEIMMTCVRLIKLINDEFYSSEYFDYFKFKTWFEPADDIEGCSTWESRTLEERFNVYFKKYPLIYNRVLKGEGPFSIDVKNPGNTIESIAMNIAHINHNRAMRLLFKIMEEHIQGWWD